MASTATPRAPPTSRRALLAPEAMPCSSGRTLDITRLAAGAKYRAMPTPPTISPGSCETYEASGAMIVAKYARPAAWRASPVTTTGRPPNRSESIPATGATSIGIPVQGSIRRPASVGEYPSTPWKYWLSRNIDPNMPRNISMLAMLIPKNARLRKSRMGSMGRFARKPWRMKPARSAAPTISAPRTVGLVQPSELALTRP